MAALETGDLVYHRGVERQPWAARDPARRRCCRRGRSEECSGVCSGGWDVKLWGEGGGGGRGPRGFARA